MAVCVINGTKFCGTPKGSSPIFADSCAPMGLKYRKAIAFKSDIFVVSKIISSLICLVFPYGELAIFIGAFSVMGKLSGSPYTVQDELKMKLLISYFSHS